MKVILQQDVKALGKKGEVVEVKEGYGRNFLLPRNLAIEANESNIKELNRQIKIKEARKEKEQEEAQRLAEKLDKITVTLAVKAGDNGKLFGAVTTKDIADILSKKHKLKVDRRKIDLDENIKSLGSYQIKVKLHPKVTANLNVKVIAE